MFKLIKIKIKYNVIKWLPHGIFLLAHLLNEFCFTTFTIYKEMNFYCSILSKLMVVISDCLALNFFRE